MRVPRSIFLLVVARVDSFHTCINRESGVTVEKSPLQCAGLNRHEVEDERALRERNSDPLGLESCAGYREVHNEA